VFNIIPNFIILNFNEKTLLKNTPTPFENHIIKNILLFFLKKTSADIKRLKILIEIERILITRSITIKIYI